LKRRWLWNREVFHCFCFSSRQNYSSLLWIKVLGNVGDEKSPSLLPVHSSTEVGSQGEGENGPKETLN